MRSRKLFTAGSIVSMSLMFISLMFGFTEDAYHSYYYSYWYKGYSYYTSFADYVGDIYWPLFTLAMIYIVFNIVAIALYHKRVKAINIVNLILANVVYIYGFIAGCAALAYENTTFAIFMLGVAFCIAYPFQLVVDILALVGHRFKNAPAAQAPAYQAPAYQAPAYQAPAYQAPVYAAPAAPTAAADNGDAIETLKQLKELYDAGVLTEAEYNAKRQQYISKI